MIPEEELRKAKEMLQMSARPLFFHDDDLDGVASFVCCRQFCGDGKGVIVKQSPVLTHEYVRKVEEYRPDLIVVLDKPKIDRAFFEGAPQPMLWIDHHEPQERFPARVLYLNPRLYADADNRPTAYWVHRITGANLWLSTVGCVADWHLPDFLEEFREQHPHLLPERFSTVEEVYLSPEMGPLIRTLQFNLKGRREDVKKSILVLSRIEFPEEILEERTPKGKFLARRARLFSQVYERLLAQALEEAELAGSLFVFIYENERHTVTGDLSNELLIRFPEKVTIVGRRHDSKIKASLRSKGVSLPDKIEEAIAGLQGYGGGHTNACGLVVKEEDWPLFLERFTSLVEQDSAAGLTAS